MWGRVRFAAPAALAVLMLGACEGQGDTARLVARQAALDPLRLWQAQEVVGRGIVMRTVRICADQKLRDSFQRAEPEVNAEPCRALGPVVTRPGLYALRCLAYGHRFGVTVTTKGDLDRAFEVSYAVTPLDFERGPFVQTVRYRMLGTCPAGWRIGDQAEVDATGTPVSSSTTDPNAAGAAVARPDAVPGLPS